MAQQFEIGIMTLGEITPDATSGQAPSAQTRMRETIETAVLADQVGLDVFGAGEHHRSDFFVSSPAVVLAAIAARTQRIRLASAVTVLSSDDPVRVFQDFATLDVISGGRAEIIAGRGSYTESFPLFGYDLDDYADLFREKLDALLAIRAGNPANWRGSAFTQSLIGLDIAPRPVGDLPIWVGIGGTTASAIRTGTLGLPLAMGLLLGPVDSFVRTVALYRQAAADAGHDAQKMRISVSTGGYVGATSQAARDIMYPAFRVGMMENNHQRGVGFVIPRPAFDAQATPGGGLLVGSPQEVIDKMMAFHNAYGLDRVITQMGFGGVSHLDHLAAIERLGTEVAPVVRQEIASGVGAAA